MRHYQANPANGTTYRHRSCRKQGGKPQEKHSEPGDPDTESMGLFIAQGQQVNDITGPENNDKANQANYTEQGQLSRVCRTKTAHEPVDNYRQCIPGVSHVGNDRNEGREKCSGYDAPRMSASTFLLPTLPAMVMVAISARIPPPNDNIMPMILPSDNKMAVTAPKAAPEDTPMIPGPTSGLPKDSLQHRA